MSAAVDAVHHVLAETRHGRMMEWRAAQLHRAGMHLQAVKRESATIIREANVAVAIAQAEFDSARAAFDDVREQDVA